MEAIHLAEIKQFLLKLNSNRYNISVQIQVCKYIYREMYTSLPNQKFLKKLKYPLIHLLEHNILYSNKCEKQNIFKTIICSLFVTDFPHLLPVWKYHYIQDPDRAS